MTPLRTPAMAELCLFEAASLRSAALKLDTK
jgi:hypothetical protein